MALTGVGVRGCQQHKCLPRLVRKDTGFSKPDTRQVLSQSLTGQGPTPPPEARPLHAHCETRLPLHLEGLWNSWGCRLPLLKRHPFLRQLQF